MKSCQKLGLIISEITSVFMSTAVVTSTYIPKAQAIRKKQAENLVVNGVFAADPLVSPYDRTRNNPLMPKASMIREILSDISVTAQEIVVF